LGTKKTDRMPKEGRDERGRFAPGNPGGPGGARRRACEFKKAAEDAITAEHVQGLMRRATRMGLEGDLGAIRFVTERVIGKAGSTPPDPVEIQLPALRSIDDCSKATDEVIAAITGGSLDREQAQLLLDAINAKLRSIELHELEARIAKIEEAANHAQGLTP